MLNFISMLAVDACKDGLGGLWTGICAALNQALYGLLTLVCKIFGLFADLMNIAFFIFAGIDINGEVSSNIYDIQVGDERKNILDYFLFSESMRKAYFFLALIGLLAIVIFTIYKIVKQDYFDKSGPRSKGPIFRNVAISCISFLLVLPIFYLIIHVSSLLSVAVMDALGMDASQLAGAKIFCLSWSDNGEVMKMVNSQLLQTDDRRLDWMWSLHSDTLFTLMADGKYVYYDTFLFPKDKDLSPILNMNKWTGSLGEYGIITDGGETLNAVFYWYIYVVGIVVAIKALYKLILAMIQRIFKLMGLFLVAPSPISQYVLDDGAKYKSWLAQSIQEGLRLVVATMSFSIYLIALNLISDINFMAAFSSAIDNASTQIPASPTTETVNVSTSLLSYSNELVRTDTIVLAAEGGLNVFESLVNAFLKIFLLMGAGGAITDLDTVLTPLISGGKSSLDAGEVGKAVNTGVSATTSLATKAVGAGAGLAMGAAGAALGAVGSLAGGAMGAIKNGVMSNLAAKAEGDGGTSTGASGPANGNGPTNGSGPSGGNSVGGGSSGGAPVTGGNGASGGEATSTATNVEGNDVETPTGENGSDTEAQNVEGNDIENNQTGDADGQPKADAENVGTPDEVANQNQSSEDKEKQDRAAEVSEQANIIKNKQQSRMKRRSTALAVLNGVGFAKRAVGQVVGKVGGLTKTAVKSLGLGSFMTQMIGIPDNMVKDFNSARSGIQQQTTEALTTWASPSGAPVLDKDGKPQVDKNGKPLTKTYSFAGAKEAMKAAGGSLGTSLGKKKLEKERMNDISKSTIGLRHEEAMANVDNYTNDVETLADNLNASIDTQERYTKDSAELDAKALATRTEASNRAQEVMNSIGYTDSEDNKRQQLQDYISGKSNGRNVSKEDMQRWKAAGADKAREAHANAKKAETEAANGIVAADPDTGAPVVVKAGRAQLNAQRSKTKDLRQKLDERSDGLSQALEFADKTATAYDSLYDALGGNGESSTGKKLKSAHDVKSKSEAASTRSVSELQAMQAQELSEIDASIAEKTTRKNRIRNESGVKSKSANKQVTKLDKEIESLKDERKKVEEKYESRIEPYKQKEVTSDSELMSKLNGDLTTIKNTINDESAIGSNADIKHQEAMVATSKGGERRSARRDLNHAKSVRANLDGQKANLEAQRAKVSSVVSARKEYQTLESDIGRYGNLMSSYSEHAKDGATFWDYYNGLDDKDKKFLNDSGLVGGTSGRDSTKRWYVKTSGRLTKNAKGVYDGAKQAAESADNATVTRYNELGSSAEIARGEEIIQDAATRAGYTYKSNKSEVSDGGSTSTTRPTSSQKAAARSKVESNFTDMDIGNSMGRSKDEKTTINVGNVTINQNGSTGNATSSVNGNNTSVNNVQGNRNLEHSSIPSGTGAQSIRNNTLPGENPNWNGTERAMDIDTNKAANEAVSQAKKNEKELDSISHKINELNDKK